MPDLPYSLGLIRQLPDKRDFRLTSAPIMAAEDLPKEVDLRPLMPGVYDQGKIGSCGPNAACGAAEFLCVRDNYPYPFQPSRLFLYYNTRKEMGTPYVIIDSGVTLRALLKAFNKHGICPEGERQHPDKVDPGWWWTYDDGKVKFRQRPKKECYVQAKLHRALRYEAVPLDAVAIKSMIAQNIPVIFGVAVYESFMSKEAARTGVIPMPDEKNEKLLGGHAMLFVGYKELEGKPYFILRNSWGDAWGDNGYGYLPEEYAIDPDLGSDYWALFNTGFEAA